MKQLVSLQNLSNQARAIFACALVLATTLAHATNAQAALVVDSGLQDVDNLQFGFSVVRTSALAYSTGGVSVDIFGRKKSDLTGEALVGKVYSAGEMRKFMDYATTVEHFEEAKVAKVDLSRPGPQAGQRTPLGSNESMSGKVSGQAINEALARAKTECPDCTKFYVAVMQDTGWGSFDILPIQNYTGFHSLNRRPGFTYHVDAKGQVSGIEVFNNFIEYHAAEE
jgi:hypothetical protein